MKKFVFLPDIALADVAFDAYGKDYSELFQHCAEAVFEQMADVTTIASKKTFKVHFTHTDITRLLFDFLSEIIYLKDAKAVVFKNCEITVAQKDKKYTLFATLHGDAINREQQQLGSDVKAVTFHQFTIVQEKDFYRARVILDI